MLLARPASELLPALPAPAIPGSAAQVTVRCGDSPRGVQRHPLTPRGPVIPSTCTPSIINASHTTDAFLSVRQRRGSNDLS
ncbi:hypothetical protein AAFF_G00155060 [Aldrovandia affinis]|uniref:Uncharacterized protein n=1 Tax=Aldrovandia affinis TaxID=143900 RepID=A0AAD7WWT0_9TELE|nr:hypothetical protein AAFF_G00155060 [Aldrovandia affinis]